MYSNFALATNHQLDNTELNYQKCIITGNWTMIISFFITVMCLMINFQFDFQFSIPVQIGAHVATIIFASLFKIGYVIRCIGVHGLGFKIF
ncbi:hypothetical protein Q4489_02540 [Thalassotalea sp. 1_MG-2023]|uniref:hypothetical protein n=1 Tax=Thalassotalea sp. 1_MG-2023 TaxID=3062680 RepID=UPI0026E3DF77|nr:hypothetical protein [Thalassotalea sp. 1_MG-2023]MDO6425868.1 hypothetical protein [Thalassotalea sp. 1_MG-2023]